MFYAVWLSAFILHEWAIRKDNEFLIYYFRYDTTLDLSVVTGVVFSELRNILIWPNFSVHHVIKVRQKCLRIMCLNN